MIIDFHYTYHGQNTFWGKKKFNFLTFCVFVWLMNRIENVSVGRQRESMSNRNVKIDSRSSYTLNQLWVKYG